MANMTAQDKVFQLPIDIVANGIVTKTLNTADTYIDKNIKITVNTPDAEFEVKKAAAVTASVSTTDTTYTSETETAYPIVIAADATAGAVTIGVKTAGFAAATDSVEVESANAEQATKTIYVKEGHLAGEGAAAVTGTISLTKVASKPSSGFYVDATATGSASVDVAGWLPVGASAAANGETFYTIPEAVFSNKEDTGTFEELTAPVLTEGGYLFIKEGYIKNSKISLATLVPDDANITSTNANLVYNTVKAYDSDGKLIVGTMGDATLGAITANDATATISSVSVAANAGKTGFVVTGSKAISGSTSVAIATRGLAETSLTQSGVISGTADVNATLAKIGLSASADKSDITVTPVIAKEDSTAKSGAITTTAPAGRYVAISTDAISASATVNPAVATAGYGTADVFDATGATVTAGAAASGTYYVPITAGSHSAVAGDPTIVKATASVSTAVTATSGFDGNLVAGVLSSAPSAGQYLTIGGTASKTAGSVSGVVTCTATEGYIEAGTQTASISGDVDVTVTDASAKYIKVYDGSYV